MKFSQCAHFLFLMYDQGTVHMSNMALHLGCHFVGGIQEQRKTKVIWELGSKPVFSLGYWKEYQIPVSCHFLMYQ